MYIPDPIELSQQNIEKQIDLIDEEDNYPCCYCGERSNVFNMCSISPDPNSPLACGKCIKN